MSFLFKSKRHQQAQAQAQTQQSTPSQPQNVPPRLITSSHGTTTSSAITSATGTKPSVIQNAITGPTTGLREAAQRGYSSSQTQVVWQRPSDADLSRGQQQAAPLAQPQAAPPVSQPGAPTQNTAQQQQQPQQQHRRAGDYPPTQNHAEKYYYPIDPSSPFPWSLRLTNYNAPTGQDHDGYLPLPRYGAAVNAVCDKDKQIYMFGGLMGSEPSNDLWVLDCSDILKTVAITEIDDRMRTDLAMPKQTDTGTVFTSLQFRKIKAKGKAPSERVGHAALLAGNAFVIFGGDTPNKVNDKLDDRLYFFNTAETQMSWTAPECRNRPAGRYGHTLTLVGNHIYLFGGQCEHIFFNDLHCYDLNKIQLDPSWIKVRPSGLFPPARTNHSMVAWSGKLYLFGGTDGVKWYNDVWVFDPAVSAWSEMSCIGYIPLAREGHSATLVDDMMYVIGGRVRDGVALRELAAFRLSSGRWFSFQNMGIPPSARSGHSMTTIDQQVVTMGGHSDALEINELRYAYVLDTKKIAFDSNPGSRQTQSSARKNTVDSTGRTTPGAGSRAQTPSQGIAAVQAAKSQEQIGSRLPRVTNSGGPPPVTTGVGHTRLASTGRSTPTAAQEEKRQEEKRSASALGHVPTDSTGSAGLGVTRSRSMSKTKDGVQYQAYSPAAKPGTASASGPTGQTSTAPVVAAAAATTVVASAVVAAATTAPTVVAAPPSVQTISRPGRSNTAPPASTADSAIGSHGTSPVVGVGAAGEESRQKVIEDLRSQIKRLQLANSWYAGEVALASKAGYTPSAFSASSAPGTAGSGASGARFSPSLDQRASLSNPESLLPHISEEERPLVQLLLRTRAELAQVQTRIEGEAGKAAGRIAEIEKQRDRAVEEVVYFKAKLASVGLPGERGGSAASVALASSVAGTPTPDDLERASGMDRRLADAVATRTATSKELSAVRAALETERRARTVAQANARASQEQMASLNSYQQRASSEIEGLKAQLHEATQRLRDELARANAADGREKMAQIEVDQSRRKLAAFFGDGEGSRDGESETVESKSGFEAMVSQLRLSVAAAASRADLLEKRSKEERQRADETEEQLAAIKSEVESLRSSLARARERAEDAELLAEQHAAEAERHRSVVDGGLERLVTRESAESEATLIAKIAVLESQLGEAETLVASSLSDTRAAEESVRQAQERIAGLENFQSTTSLENLRIRDQLQAATLENSNLVAEAESAARKFEAISTERETLRLQLDTLSALVEEHGLREASEETGKEVDSGRITELESQLHAAAQSRSAAEADWAHHEAELQTQWTSRLDRLESDYETATRQVASFEQVIAQMSARNRRVEIRAKQFKELNQELRTRLEDAESRLLSYISQDMEHGDRDDDSDGDVDHEADILASRSRNTTATGSVQVGRISSTLSLSSDGDDELTGSVVGKSSSHKRMQDSLSSADGRRTGSRTDRRMNGYLNGVEEERLVAR